MTAGPMTAVSPRRKPIRPPRVVLHVFLAVMAIAWLMPLLWGAFNSFRDYQYTAEHG